IRGAGPLQRLVRPLLCRSRGRRTGTRTRPLPHFVVRPPAATPTPLPPYRQPAVGGSRPRPLPRYGRRTRPRVRRAAGGGNPRTASPPRGGRPGGGTDPPRQPLRACTRERLRWPPVHRPAATRAHIPGATLWPAPPPAAATRASAAEVAPRAVAATRRTLLRPLLPNGGSSAAAPDPALFYKDEFG